MDPGGDAAFVDWPKKFRVKGKQFVDLLFSQNFRRRYSFFRTKVFSPLAGYAAVACLVGYTFQYGIGAVPKMHNQCIQEAYKERGM